MNKERIEKALKRYGELKNDKTYRIYYKNLKSLERLIETEDISNNGILLYEELSGIITKKWDIRQPVSPFLRIKKIASSHRSISSGSSLGKILSAVDKDFIQPIDKKSFFKSVEFFNVLSSSRHRGKEKISDSRKDMDLKKLKFLVHFLHAKFRLSFRALERFFYINHNTIKVYVEEVNTWTESEKEIVLQAFSTGKDVSAKDALDDKFKVSLYHDSKGYGESGKDRSDDKINDFDAESYLYGPEESGGDSLSS